MVKQGLFAIFYGVHLSLTVLLSLWLEMLYQSSGLYVEALAELYPGRMTYVGTPPLSRLILFGLLAVLGLHTAWFVYRTLTSRNETLDDDGRKQRQRWILFGLHTFFTVLLYFVTHTLRVSPDHYRDSGSYSIYYFPLTWMPFTLMMVTLVIHFAALLYHEILYRQDAGVMKRKLREGDTLEEENPFNDDESAYTLRKHG